MRMENIWVILGLTVFSIILGIIWYGPLFGKKFAWANDWPDFSTLSKEEQAAKQKQVMPYYLLQAVVTFVQIMVLAWFVETLGRADGVEIALWLWLGFIMPIMVGASIWNMQPNNKRLTILSIGLSYQVVLMLVSGYVFSLL
jgi:hypothetical protein